MDMVQHSVELLDRLRNNESRTEFEHLLYEAASRFMAAFYLHQEAQLRKATRELDAELARDIEPLS